ncbi:MAG: hypothetical protein Kow0099_13110 [Candidatus Abyssubacteria bacterium]
MQIDTLRERFARPPAQFGPTPFWFLNDDLDEGRLSDALNQMKSKGFAGVILHPRTGMEVEYLSESFWERLRFVCETLGRLDMQGWIYDDYNWPSGPAGGKLLREHPEFRQRGLDYRRVPVSRLPETVRDLTGELIAAFSVSGAGVRDATDALKRGDLGAFSTGDALLFFVAEYAALLPVTCGAPWTKAETGYLDLLNPAAVDAFMRITHDEYDRHLRHYYGSPLVGIFTDEPANYVALPYTQRLPERYEERFGRSFREALPSLAGRLAGVPREERIRSRTHYFELARDMYVESFFGTLSAWASERGLVFTGHVNEDDRIDRLPSSNVSLFAPLSRMHMPGTDLLGENHGYEKVHPTLRHANFNPKALSSTAHHCGAERALCEIWGGNGWATPPEKLKTMLNWAVACGVNFVNPHAVFMSLRGLRKRDFPASHFPPQPWWRFYEKFSEYIARLSFLGCAGAHVADVLFAFPLKSLWAEFDLKDGTSRLADFIEAASEALLRNQLDFDYLFDEVLERDAVEVEEAQLKVRDETYSVLVLPLAAVMPAKLLELTERFASAGGRIVAVVFEMPAHDEYGAEISARIEALFGPKERAGVAHRQLTTDVGSDLDWLVKSIKKWISPDLVAEGSLARDLICLHRRLEDVEVYFVSNLGKEEGNVDLAFRCRGRPQLWDPEDGSCANVLAYTVKGGYTRLTARFHPGQAFFFAFTDEPPVDHVDSTNLKLTSVTIDYAEGYTSALEVRVSRGDQRYTRTVEQAYPVITLSGRWELDYPVRNILLLDRWDVEILSDGNGQSWSPREDPRLGVRGRFLTGVARAAFGLGRAIRKSLGTYALPTTKYVPMGETYDIAEKWCKLLGIDFTRLDSAEVLLEIAKYVGYPMGYDYPPAGSTFAMTGRFHADHIPDDLTLVFEDGPLSVEVNGAEVHAPSEPTFVWDASNKALPVAGLVKKGENRVRLVCRQPDFPTLHPSVHGLEPVCLTGTFWVEKGKIVEQKYGAPSLPWSETGFPNYIGALTYKSSFELPMRYMGQQLFFKFDRLGATAEVKINGRHAGVVLWRPYALDVTKLVVQGENSVEVTVANTAANLLAEPVPAGIIGTPYIVPYWRHRLRFGV